MPRGRPPGVGNYHNHFNHAQQQQQQQQQQQHFNWVDSRRPKGKMTAYAFFVQVCLQEHRRKYPDEVIPFTDFAKKTADRWKIMSEKEKRRFNIMADEDKKRFELEMNNYQVNC